MANIRRFTDSTHNPRCLLHAEKIDVWCARTVGPLFLTKHLVYKIYVQVILEQFFPQLREEERLYGWFKQDLVTEHTARVCMQALSDATGRELSAEVFRQQIDPVLIPVIFSRVV